MISWRNKSCSFFLTVSLRLCFVSYARNVTSLTYLIPDPAGKIQRGLIKFGSKHSPFVVKVNKIRAASLHLTKRWGCVGGKPSLKTSFVSDTCADAVKAQEWECLISMPTEGRHVQHKLKTKKTPDYSLLSRRIWAFILSAQKKKLKCENWCSTCSVRRSDCKRRQVKPQNADRAPKRVQNAALRCSSSAYDWHRLLAKICTWGEELTGSFFSVSKSPSLCHILLIEWNFLLNQTDTQHNADKRDIRT